MTELELYKYITENNIEWRRDNNDGTPDVLIFPLICEVKEFNELVKGDIEEGVECRMRDGYFAFWMKDICDYYGIDIDKIFVGKEN